MSPLSPRHWLAGPVCAVGLLLFVPSRAIAPVPRVTSQAAPSPKGLEAFDLSRSAATQLELPRGLREVSGLATTSDGRLFAHADERAIVHEVDPRSGAILKSFTLGATPVAADLEGIAIDGERFFLIASNGHLYETREGAAGSSMRYTVHRTGFGARCEIEGLAFDPATRVLLAGCKTPYAADLRDRVTLFRWSVDRQAPATPAELSVPLADAVGSADARRFGISTIERDPVTGHYVIVAGPQRLIAELTPAGKVVISRTLDHRLHPQPEGLAFEGDSVMLIADEGGSKRGTLTRYRRAR